MNKHGSAHSTACRDAMDAKPAAHAPPIAVCRDAMGTEPTTYGAPSRRLRMQGWDFTSPGWYFLTTSTNNMHSLFGSVAKGAMHLNAAGKVADACWREIPAHFPRAVLHEHVVMPNHVHGLLQLKDEGWSFAGHKERLEAFGKPVAGSISTIIRSYKAAVSKALGTSVWQRRFYEVRARDEAARNNIRRYIRDNPANFEAVMNGPEPQYIGNKELLERPKVAFLASRGASQLHGKLPLKPGEVLIFGFLSPLERSVYRAALAHKRPLIHITACRDAMDMDAEPAAHSAPIHTLTACREVLVVAPFPSSTLNERRALWCNQYALAHAQRIIIGHLNPDGMLACLLHEVDPQKEIIFL